MALANTPFSPSLRIFEVEYPSLLILVKTRSIPACMFLIVLSSRKTTQEISDVLSTATSAK